MRCLPKLIIFSAFLSSLFFGECDANIVVYDFENPPPEAATTVDPLVTTTVISSNNLTASQFGFASGLGYPSSTVVQVNPPNVSTPAAAVAANQYFSFTVTPVAGAELDLASLAFDAARGGGGTPRGFEVRSSVDAFASTLGTADIPTIRPTLTPFSVDLSAAAFDSLTAPVEFRFYSYSPIFGNTVEFDNISLNGVASASIPEPAGALMFALAAGGLLMKRRR